VRFLVAIAGLGACYAPAPPAGAPCDPLTNNCPDGQTCRAEPGGHFCRAPGTPLDETDAPTVDAPAAAVDAPDAPLAPATFTYAAVVAECVDPVTPSPARCRTVNGQDQLAVDRFDSAERVEWAAYLAFPLDDKLAGRTVVAAKVRVVATDDTDADAPNTGQLWQVQPFTLESLGTTAPARVGNTPLAGSQGAVDQLQPVEWPVPPALIADGVVYVSIQTGVDEGALYWNNAGATPPRLIVDVE
jgi:hypothetical protein